MPDQEKTQQKASDKLEVSLEDIGPARKCLTIEIPPERITEKIESNYSKLHTDSTLPGFRKGRVPRRLLEKRFKSSVHEDARNQLLGECYDQAIKDHDLDVIGEPDIKDFDQIKLPEDGALSFKVEVEISPKVELPDLTSIEIKKESKDVTDKDVDEEIEKLRTRFGQLTEVQDTKISEQDYVKAQVRIFAGKDTGDDGKIISQEPDVWIVVNGKEADYKGHVVGIVVDQLGKKLAGKKGEDQITVSMTGPPGHENDQIKDQPITIIIDIKAVHRHQPAELDVLITNWGLASQDELKKKILDMLKERSKSEQRGAMHKQVCDYLLEKIDLELPQGLTSRQSARLLQREAMELTYQGLDGQEIEQKIAEARQSTDEKARHQLKQFFILDQAAKNLGIEVSEAELNGQIASLAMQQGRRPEKLRQEMHKKGELEYLYLQIREQKTLDKIIESAKVIEESAKAPEAKSTAPKSTQKKTTKSDDTEKTADKPKAVASKKKTVKKKKTTAKKPPTKE